MMDREKLFVIRELSEADIPFPPRAARDVTWTYVWDRLAPASSLLLFLLFEVVTALSIIVYACRTFGFSMLLVLFHAPVAMLWIATAAFGPATLLYLAGAGRHPSGVVARIAVSVAGATAMMVLLVIYIGSFISSIWWGSTLDYSFFKEFVLRGGVFHGEMPDLSPVVYFASAAVFALLAFFYMRVSNAIFLALEDVSFHWRAFHLGRRPNRQRTGIQVAAVLVLLAGGSWIWWQFGEWKSLLDRDPIVALFRYGSASTDVGRTLLVAQLRKNEPLVRAAYPKGLSFDRKNVVIITVDSLRPDHLPMYGYARPVTPFLSSLYDAGKLQKGEFFTSTCAESNCGIFSTLSSKPLRYQVLENFKLFELLQDQGYRTYMILSGNQSLFETKGFYGTDRTLLFDGSNSKRFGWSDDRLLFEGMERVPHSSDKPAFFYFHLMSTQFTGTKLDEYRVYNPSRLKNSWQLLIRGDFDRNTVINNYDNGVLQADHTIRRLFEELRQKGYLTNSIVFILADHGEHLGERGPHDYGHITSLGQPLIHIPLLVYDDDGGKPLNTRFGTQIDIAPTVLERLGLPIPSSWQGRSLLQPDGDRYTYHQTKFKKPVYAVLHKTGGQIYKYVLTGKEEELFETVSDPREQHNLIEKPEHSALLADFRTKLAAYRGRE